MSQDPFMGSPCVPHFEDPASIANYVRLDAVTSQELKPLLETLSTLELQQIAPLKFSYGDWQLAQFDSGNQYLWMRTYSHMIGLFAKASALLEIIPPFMCCRFLEKHGYKWEQCGELSQDRWKKLVIHLCCEESSRFLSLMSLAARAN